MVTAATVETGMEKPTHTTITITTAILVLTLVIPAGRAVTAVNLKSPAVHLIVVIYPGRKRKNPQPES
jgi:hypothetical protein